MLHQKGLVLIKENAEQLAAISRKHHLEGPLSCPFHIRFSLFIHLSSISSIIHLIPAHVCISADPSKGEGAREAGILRIEGVPCFVPILMHSLGDVWHPGSGVPCFGGFCSLWGLTVSLSSLFFPIFLMHSLGDVWHPGSGVPCFGGFCSLWGLTVSLSSLFFPILMHSLGDVWHPGSGVPCFGGFCSLWGLTVSLSSLFFPIFLMHSLGDVWHPGSGVPCFAGFAAFGGSQSHFLPYSSLS